MQAVYPRSPATVGHAAIERLGHAAVETAATRDHRTAGQKSQWAEGAHPQEAHPFAYPGKTNQAGLGDRPDL